MEQNVVLEMRDISKNFTGVRALSHVDFTLRKGEIHALMGENGAGKSTLIKVLTGVHEFESGSIRMADKEKNIINHSPQEAQENGISTVYQEVNLCPNLTVAENLFIVTPDELRKDMNSIIHSNRFEYNRLEVIVYSQKGKEHVDLNALLAFCHHILSSDKLRNL